MARSTKDNGSTTRCTERASSGGPTARSTTVTLRKTSAMVWVASAGRTAASTRVSGPAESNTESEFTATTKAKSAKENGSTAAE